MRRNVLHKLTSSYHKASIIQHQKRIIKNKSGLGLNNIRATFNEPSTRVVPFPSFLDKTKCVSVIGAPMCAGQRKAGVDKGPSQLRDVGLLDNLKGLGWKVHDFGDLE